MSTTCMYHRGEDLGHCASEKSPLSWDSKALLIAGHVRIAVTHGVGAAAVSFT